MAGNAEIGDYVRKDGGLVQVQSIDQPKLICHGRTGILSWMLLSWG